MPSDSYIVKRSLFFSFMGRYANTALQFVSVVILARLLTPEDIGIYTVGLAIIGIAHMIRDFGIGKYLVQEKNLTPDTVASAFGLTIAIAWSLGAMVMFLAPFVAQFYEEPAVESVVLIVGLNFFIIPLGAMSASLLKRSMSFGTLFKINIASTFASVVVGISLALMGFGFLSMAWASVANVAVTAIGAQYYLPKKYRVYPRLKGSKKILSFGSHVVGANIVTEVNASSLDLLVGKFLGFAELGFLSRGQGFVKIYGNIIQKGANPVIAAQLSKRHRSGDAVESSFAVSLMHLTVIGWFALGLMGIMSSELIAVLYGDQWTRAAPLATLLCLLSAIGVPTTLARSLLISTGRVKLNFRLVLFFSAIRISLILLFVDRGLEFLLMCFLLLATTNFVVTYSVICWTFKFQATSFIRILAKNLVIVLGALIFPVGYVLNPDLNLGNAFSTSMIVCSISCLAWVFMVFCFRHPIADEFAGALSQVNHRLRSKVAR